MDFHQFHGLTGTNLSSDIYPRNLMRTERTYDSIKLALGNSPDFTLCSQVEFDNFSMISNVQQYCSMEAISKLSPSGYCQLHKDSALEQSQVLQDGNQAQPDSLHAISHQSLRHALQEIETVLMAPDFDELTTSTYPQIYENKPNLTNQSSRTWTEDDPSECSTQRQPQYLFGKFLNPNGDFHPEKCLNERREVSNNDVKQLLIKCAEALSENKAREFETLLEEAQSFVSVSGEPIERLGTYMLEGLVARRKSSGSNIYRALQCHQPESKNMLSYTRIMYDICPYYKFGYMAANGAIADALKNENRIHIIDFQIAQGTQWITLIRALAIRPGGPPHIRITGIDDPVPQNARGEGLQLVGKMLSDMSKKFNIPLEFKGLPVHGPEVTREMLEIRSGEALAVNFTLHLHHTPDESVDVSNPRDGLLRMVKGLSPKVTTLVEQESNTNTTPFLARFMETLDYYSAMLESIDVTLPRDSKERINVEQHCLAKDIVNVLACEGKDRIERHELLGKWRSRLTMAGFKPYPLSSYVNSVIKTLLGYYSDKHTLLEKDGALLLGWNKRNLISASAWH